jgi:hypothetical protein
MNPLIQSKNTTILPVLIALTLACFALSPPARAVCQEGCLTNENTVLGDEALLNNTGSANTAIGFDALSFNTTGFNNTATGYNTLLYNTTGFYNTATGGLALENNTIGNFNTATGAGALQVNTTGNNNTATGGALGHNTTGDDNTATGFLVLDSNTTGLSNTAAGSQALTGNTTGNYNTANGQGSLYSNRTGSNNTADGQNALRSNTTGKNNIAVGSNAGFNLTTGNNNIDIFDKGVAGEANTIRIGKVGTQTNTFIAGISGATVPTGVAVIVDTTGHLGTTTSSARYKDNVQPMEKASEAILALKPVTFHYKHELDPEGVPQFGLVAEDVEKVNSDLVARDEQGKPYTVRYDAVNAMLLNEFLKEHKTVQELKKEIAALTATVKEQAAQMQKVSAQIEASKPAPKVVLNP